MKTKLIESESRGGYTIAAVQFVDDDYTSSVIKIPSNGKTDNIRLAIKQAEKFAAIAAATAQISMDAGVRNCILEGAARGLRARYGW